MCKYVRIIWPSVAYIHYYIPVEQNNLGCYLEQFISWYFYWTVSEKGLDDNLVIYFVIRNYYYNSVYRKSP